MDKIILNPSEATAYWWIKKIKAKIKEINNNDSNDPDEKRFASLFDNFTEIDWRKLYLELSDLIEGDIKDNKNDYFIQGTKKGEHNQINFELMIILSEQNNLCELIPDISITTAGLPDSTIYTNDEMTYVFKTDDNVLQQVKNAYPFFLLTGDDDDLYCYNYLVTTLAIINEDNDSRQRNLQDLKQALIRGYKEYLLPDEDIKSITERATRAIEYAKQNGIMKVKYNTKPPTYKIKLADSDYNEIDLYIEYAIGIASIVLNKSVDQLKESGKNCISKIKRKRL